jgi:hypothetical protein
VPTHNQLLRQKLDPRHHSPFVADRFVVKARAKIGPWRREQTILINYSLASRASGNLKSKSRISSIGDPALFWLFKAEAFMRFLFS